MAVQVQESVTSEGPGMAVTVEQVKAAQAAMTEAGEDYLPGFRRHLERQKTVADAGPLALKVAESLRSAYYDDGEPWTLAESRHPEQWLRMAEAATAAVREAYGAAENPGAPAVAKVGDVYQLGDTIAPNVTEVSSPDWHNPLRRKIGGEFGVLVGWGPVDTSDPDGSWVAEDFPLTVTAISGPPKREPRVFEAGDTIPDDVTELVDTAGRTYHLRENGSFSSTLPSGHLARDTSAWSSIWPDRFPLIEGATTDGWEMH